MAKRLLISGAVQGVGYRQWMCREADRLGLNGWVRNLRDGSVESVVDGAPQAVSEMIERTRYGPPAARVTAVRTEDVPGSFSEFEWRASA
jgi:acylphosphatase